MTVKNWILSGVMVFGFAACSQEAEPDRSAEEAEVATSQNATDSTEPDAKPQEEETQTDEAETSPSPAATPETPATLSSIPVAFLGVWDAETGTCSRESDLRLEISPQQIIFYESLGEVRWVTKIDAGTVDLMLAMEGEGEIWEDTYRLSLTNDGEQLATSYPKQSAPGAPVPRKKCPQ